MNNNLTIIEKIFAFILGIILFLLVLAVGCWLWGVIAVSIFGLPELTYWQFAGLYVICNMLFNYGSNDSNELKTALEKDGFKEGK